MKEQKVMCQQPPNQLGLNSFVCCWRSIYIKIILSVTITAILGKPLGEKSSSNLDFCWTALTPLLLSLVLFEELFSGLIWSRQKFLKKFGFGSAPPLFEEKNGSLLVFAINSSYIFLKVQWHKLAYSFCLSQYIYFLIYKALNHKRHQDCMIGSKLMQY